MTDFSDVIVSESKSNRVETTSSRPDATAGVLILRLRLCVMIFNCSGEWPFSELKRVKNDILYAFVYGLKNVEFFSSTLHPKQTFGKNKR